MKQELRGGVGTGHDLAGHRQGRAAFEVETEVIDHLVADDRAHVHVVGAGEVVELDVGRVGVARAGGHEQLVAVVAEAHVGSAGHRSLAEVNARGAERDGDVGGEAHAEPALLLLAPAHRAANLQVAGGEAVGALMAHGGQEQGQAHIDAGEAGGSPAEVEVGRHHIVEDGLGVGEVERTVARRRHLDERRLRVLEHGGAEEALGDEGARHHERRDGLAIGGVELEVVGVETALVPGTAAAASKSIRLGYFTGTPRFRPIRPCFTPLTGSPPASLHIASLR